MDLATSDAQSLPFQRRWSRGKGKY